MGNKHNLNISSTNNILSSSKIFNNPSAKTAISKEKNVSFGAAPVYKVTNLNPLKKVIPTISFLGSVVSATGYFLGSLALFYDSYKERSMKKAILDKQTESNSDETSISKKSKNINNEKEEGVKTIAPVTKVGRIGMIFGKIGVGSSALAGMSCGLVEGIPTMAVGEATNLASASIIETPIGTGLFGIGIASIFSGLALENTPKLKLNYYKLMAAEGFSQKAKLIGQNMKMTMKEIFSSVSAVAKNIYKPKFIKEAFLKGTPDTVVFKEAINKNGKASIIERALRHDRNYMMHAASFTLGMGGLGIILASIFNQKKVQKAGLVVEEGGFLFDNLGMTRFGLDKLTTGSKAAGSNFAIGGVINAISQFMGLDNKDGRAMQWLGIALVFAGFGIDRGKFLKKTLAGLKQRPELQDVVREWKIDLSKVFKDKNELKTLLKELKKGNVTNIKFKAFDSAFKKNIGNEIVNSEKTASYEFKDLELVKKNLAEDTEKELERLFKRESLINIRSEFKEKLTKLNRQKYKEFRKLKLNEAIENNYNKNIKKQGTAMIDEIFKNIVEDNIADFKETKNILKICTEKTFGSENPKPIAK